MFYVLVASVPLVLLAKWILVGDPKPVKGVYSMPGLWYPLKYCVFWVMLQLRRRQNAAHKLTSGDAGYGLRSRVTVQDMEKAQHLPEEHTLAVDAVYFNGCDGNGNYLVAATARRHENIVQTILLVRVPDLGLLELPSFPETNLKGTEKGEFAAGGLVISPVDPMKTWRLTYSGKLRHVQTGEMRNVTFDLTWSALTRYFDFDTDMNPAAMCSAIATEPWSREFFNRLKEYHQTHYEQFGEMKGNVEIEKFGSRSVSLQGVRDHSYGNIRSWSDLHRYILQYVYTEGGRCVCMGAISMPRTMSRLPMGYIFHPDGTMDSIQSSDFQFYNMGDDGLPPHEFTFHFTAGGRQYELKGKEVASSVFFMGTEWGARVHERLCTYSLNGEPAWGISEWEYRNPLGREAVVES